MKKRGFISHIHEEAGVAEYIRQFVDGVFSGALDLFVSSLDISAGDWLEQIKLALQDTSFVFPLLSYASRHRPWINFESGAAFIGEEIHLIPLCHRGLIPRDLDPPFSHFQAYDLSDPKRVTGLIRYLSSQLNVPAGRYSSSRFCRAVAQLDGLEYHFITSFDSLRSSKELSAALRDKTSMLPIEIGEVDIWDELELRARVHNRLTLELNGHTRESTGFSIYEIDVPTGNTHLIVKLANTANSISNDKDRMLIVAINRQRIVTAIEPHRHYADKQYVVKGDGLFAFELPELAKRSGKISGIDFSFWRIDLRGLLLELYLA